MKLSKKEEMVIEYWEKMVNNGNGKVVIEYDTPEETRDSMVLCNVKNGDDIKKGWEKYCGGDPEVGIIKEVMWCGDVISL